MTPLHAHGMVLGKFMPPHLGHLHLVDVARGWVDDLTVVVGSLPSEPIPGELRVMWMRELFPDVRVVHLPDDNPQVPDEHADFWGIWRRSLLRVLPRPPELVFSGEPYGERLAAELGARFVPLSQGRQLLPVSGSAIRTDPWSHWRWLPRCVRPHFVRRVCVVGAESTGKTTLARDLAARFDTVWVPEFARTLLEQLGRPPALEDFSDIVRGQIASEEALARQANRLLVCDTDPFTTTLWAEALVGRCPPEVRQAAERGYDLYLLTDPTTPFEADPVRYRPDERAAFHGCLEQGLRARGASVVPVSGEPAARLAIAAAAIEARFGPA